MEKSNRWNEEYWRFVLQLYLRKPRGVKPLYDRDAVDLCLKIHVAPEIIHDKMKTLDAPDTPWLRDFRSRYEANPHKLKRAIDDMQRMTGFGFADAFYQGVETNETFETDFRPIPGCDGLTGMMLTIMLDLYFKLTPPTMVPETPEIVDLAKLLRIRPELVVRVLVTYQYCDSYLNRRKPPHSPLLDACLSVWSKYDGYTPEALSSLATELLDYFRP